mmetsp:Transcript_14238/g.42446  ORF Transcript_14238/g.42446 Transcript_14238/m.42446 type:complete len:227 (+) Transcript_14238:126-806(+)
MSPFAHTNASRQYLGETKVILAQAQENSQARTYTRPAFLVPDARIETSNNEKNMAFTTGTFKKMSREEYLMSHLGFTETAPLPGPQTLKLSKKALEASGSLQLLPATPEDGRRLARAPEGGSVASASTCSRSAASRTRVSRASRASGEGSLASHKGSVADAARQMGSTARMDFSEIIDRWGNAKQREPWTSSGQVLDKFSHGGPALYSETLAMRVSGPAAFNSAFQ